jgi:hypothetical protein
VLAVGAVMRSSVQMPSLWYWHGLLHQMRFKCKHLDFGGSAVFLFAFSFFLFSGFILFFGKTGAKNAAGIFRRRKK